MIFTMYWLLNLYYELFQRSLNQMKFNLQQAKKLSHHMKLEYIPMLK